MSTVSPVPDQLKLTEPAVEAAYVSQEFAEATAAHIERAKAFLVGESEEIPYGFTQGGDAYSPPAETERDYYIGQLSLAFTGDHRTFDEHMTDFEKRNAATSNQEQPPGSPPNAVTVSVRPFMWERLGMPGSTETMAVSGAVIRGVELPGSQPGRGLDLFEVELPARDAEGEPTMARLVYFVKK